MSNIADSVGMLVRKEGVATLLFHGVPTFVDIQIYKIEKAREFANLNNLYYGEVMPELYAVPFKVPATPNDSNYDSPLYVSTFDNIPSSSEFTIRVAEFSRVWDDDDAVPSDVGVAVAVLVKYPDGRVSVVDDAGVCWVQSDELNSQTLAETATTKFSDYRYSIYRGKEKVCQKD